MIPKQVVFFIENSIDLLDIFQELGLYFIEIVEIRGRESLSGSVQFPFLVEADLQQPFGRIVMCF